MNTNPQSNPYPNLQAQSINPALLSAFQAQALNQTQIPNQSQQQQSLSQNHAISQHQHGSAKFPYGNPSFNTGVSPAQLMNGIGNIGMGSVPTSGQQHSMNPAQVLQQQHQLLGMAVPGMGAMPGLAGMNGMAMGGVGINPAALNANIASSASANTLGTSNLALSGGLGMAGQGSGIGSDPSSSAHAASNSNITSLPHSNQHQHSSQSQLQQQQTSQLHTNQHSQLAPNSAMNFNLMSFSREQLAQLSQSLSPQERQLLQAKMAFAAQQHHHQQNMQQMMQQQQLPQSQHGHSVSMNSNLGPGIAFPSADPLGVLPPQQRANLASHPSSQSLPNQLAHTHPHQQNAGVYYERERSSSSSSSHNQSHGQSQSQNQGHQPHQAVQHSANNPGTSQGHQGQNQRHATPQSMVGNAQAVMMPPPPRPSTAQSQTGPSHASATSSRPGTAQSHRPPSREFSREFSAGLGTASMNGFVTKPPTPLQPPTPQLQHQMQMQMSAQNMYSNQGQPINAFPQTQGAGATSGVGNQMSIGYPGQPQGQGQGQPGFPAQGRMSPSVPGSPYRGAKRKASGLESPRIGSMGMNMNIGMGGFPGVTGMGGLGMGSMNMGVGISGTGGTGTGSIMGPPVLPRQLSNPPDQGQGQQINGYPLPPQQPQVTQSQQHAISGGLMSHPAHGMMSMGDMRGSGIPNLAGTSTASGIGMGIAPHAGNMVGHQQQTSLGPQTPVAPFPGLSPHVQQQHAQLPMQIQQQQQQQQHAQQHNQMQQAQVPNPLALLGPKNREMAMGMGLGHPKAGGGGVLRMPSSVPGGLAPSLASGLGSTTDTVVNGITATPAPPPPPPGLKLPSGVMVNPAVTRITTVPLAEAAEAIPPLSPETAHSVRGWMDADRVYDGIWRRMRERMTDEVREVRGRRNAWWERDPEGMAMMARRGRREGFDVRYPRTQRDRDRDARDKRRIGRREGLKLPRKLKPEDADRPEQLVPIRLEFDVEHHKMRDSFVWNLNDPVVTPENFAQSIVDDYGLAPAYHAVITKSIQEQLSDFKAHSANYDGDSEDIVVEDTLEKGKLDEEAVAWWAKWRKSIRTDAGYVRRKKLLGKAKKRRKLGRGDARVLSDIPNGTAEKDVPVGEELLDVDDKVVPEEMRILIKLDIIVGAMKLDDQFEWDLDNEDASPEQFAEVYVKELGLGGEFRTAIAHCIREQVQIYQKSLFLVGRPSDGSPIQDEDLRSSFLPSLASGTRPINEVLSFTPLLNYLSDGELERNEKERDRDLNKRRKRNMRSRRGLALPDREPIRTYRTPAIGFPELDAATQALAAAANAPTSRRAAAAAASLTIANMVASENGTPFMPQTMPIVTNPTPVSLSSRERKPKGLFKPPSYPRYILRPRAPTLPTAVDTSSFPAPVETDLPPPTAAAVAPPPDSKAAKALTAKRAKELEREAKEKEYADGQHANIIDGVWHCSNCGCPEHIAVGRRKGPLGDKSQCGPCGKFWHRHRRPLPVEYNSDPEFHLNLKREAELAKTVAKKKGGAAALRAQNAAAAAQADGSTESPLPRRGKGDVWVEIPSRSSVPPSAPVHDDERPISPVSTTSSASEPPLAQRIKGPNGVNHTRSTPNSSSASAQAQGEIQDQTLTPADFSTSSTMPKFTTAALPEWLALAVQEMQEKYPDDKFEVISRKLNALSPPEWRIKCLDCPGKLYTPGPAETLSNYEVHIKNRQHRQRVNSRVNGGAAA